LNLRSYHVSLYRGIIPATRWVRKIPGWAMGTCAYGGQAQRKRSSNYTPPKRRPLRGKTFVTHLNRYTSVAVIGGTKMKSPFPMSVTNSLETFLVTHHKRTKTSRLTHILFVDASTLSPQSLFFPTALVRSPQVHSWLRSGRVNCTTFSKKYDYDRKVKFVKIPQLPHGRGHVKRS
jgi:hypothetical protein